MEEDEWEEMKDWNFWTPDKSGEFIEGTITSMTSDNFGLKVTLESTDKKEINLPSHTVLQNRIKNCKVGDYIKVIFEKTELPKIKGHNPTNIYKVMKRKDIPVEKIT